MTAKPTSTPRWADTGVVVEPSEAKKDSGWVAPELPPDTFFNWHQNLVGTWVKWINERLFDDGAEEDFQIKSPSGAVDGGGLSLRGGAPGIAAGNGGDVDVRGGGTGAAGGVGGAVNIVGGVAGSGTSGSVNIMGANSLSGSSGGVVVTGGAGPTPGAVSVAGGGAVTSGAGALVAITGGVAAGSDIGGGAVNVSGGLSKGNQGSTVSLRAAISGSAGSGNRFAQDFFVADGTADENQSKRPFVGEQGILGEGRIAINDGSGIVGQGIAAGTALGGTENNPGTGVHGRGADNSGFGGDDGYGVVAEANATTPDRSSLRVVPQSAEPLTAQLGDIYIDSPSGKFSVHNGSSFRKFGGVFAIDSSNPTVTGVFGDDTFPAISIPSNHLVIGDIINIQSVVELTTYPGGTPPFFHNMTIGGSAVASAPMLTGLVGGHYMMEATCEVRSLGATASIRSVSRNTWLDLPTSPNSLVRNQSGALVVDSTSSLSVVIGSGNNPTAGFVWTLIQFIVRIN